MLQIQYIYIYNKTQEDNNKDWMSTVKQSKKEQALFHTFIQNTDKLPIESTIFPYFQYMDQSIRKKFHQLKKTGQKKQKQLNYFQELWNQLDNDDKVNLYCNWTRLLLKAIQIQKNPKIKQQLEFFQISDEVYIKKHTALFTKWEKRNVKLTANQLIILSKTKNKQFDLKDYQIRKSKSRQNFSWLLQPINKNGKPLQCGVSSQTMFDQWYNAIKANVNNQRVLYFLSCIIQEKQNPGSVSRKFSEQKAIQKNKKENQNMKTLTQRMIDKQMKIQGLDGSLSDDDDQFQDFEDKPENKQLQNEYNKKEKKENLKQQEKIIQTQKNPNIFKRLAPQYTSIMTFAETPINTLLIHCDSDYRIYQLSPSQNASKEQSADIVKLKFFSILPYSKQLVFRAIVSESIGWNQQIDLLSVKTKISSENTVLIYQKNKPQGILYRERDFLYLRHCFSISNYKQKNTFVIDKSIDSIHHPPFMTVVRAQKQIIWGLIEKQSGKQCLLIVEGWIKGGGYMNAAQNKDMTLKYMKKLINLNSFIKHLTYQPKQNNNTILKQDWLVDFSKQDLTEVKKENRNKLGPVLTQQQEQIVQRKGSNFSQKYEQNQNQQKQLQQFMARTEEELANQSLNKSQIFFSQQRLQKQLQNYTPPSFNQQKLVIIPNKYLSKIHILVPKQKPKKPKYFPHYRGHHLWKGEWSVLPVGGLGYIDQQKMQEQKKVLTYIIKRIGKNIFSGKGILNISLPVDIFCVQSNIQRIAMSFGYYPYYMQKAVLQKQPQNQMKYIIASGISSSLIYLTMQKPFNPILGQTFQCWIDNCPIYFQQISHHPPIAAFMMKGRGYTVSGCVQAKMDLSINSGTGINQGISKVQFDDGNTYYFTTAAGCLTGLTYGQRKLNFVGKCTYWSQSGLFLQVFYNPALKTKSFFGGIKGQGQQKLADYFEGHLKQYSTQSIKEISFKKCQNRQIPIIPKGPPNVQAQKTFYKVYGRWNKYIMCGQQKIFDVDENRYYPITQQKYPLPSHSNYRQDIVYRRLKNFIQSQQFKEVLQVRQRQDRKLRAKFNKNNTTH